MGRIYIFGISAFSRRMRDYLVAEGREVAAFTLDQAYLSGDTLDGLPLLPFECLDEHMDMISDQVLIAIGYTQMNTLRETIFRRCKRKGYRLAEYIHPTAWLDHVERGEASIILERVFIGPGSRIGDANILWNGVNLSHDLSMGSFNYLAPAVVSAGEVHIGDGCFLGTASIISSRRRLADHSLIGAGAYLNADTEAGDVVVPAKSVTLQHKRSFDMKI